MVSSDVATFNLHPELITVVPLVLLCLTAIAVLLRVYVRGVMLRAFGLDDWLLVAAWCFFVVDCSLWIKVGYVERSRGLIEPVLEISELTLVGICFYLIDQMTLKLSLATFFLRINQVRWHRWIIISSVSLYIIYTTAFLFVAVFQCGNPKPGNFVSYDQCLDWTHVVGPLNYIAAVLNAAIDWIFTGVTVLVILGTQIGRGEKASVCAILAVGALGSVVSVVRIPFVKQLKLSPTYFSNNPQIEMLSIAESAIGIIAISMATLRPLVRLCMDKAGFRSSTAQQSNRPKSHARITTTKATRHSMEMDFITTPDKTDVFGITSVIEANPSAHGSDKDSVGGRSVKEQV
ncbi:hypothetical protein MBLNU459_g6601t1 [Dothideomycetes sp. NU459]